MVSLVRGGAQVRFDPVVQRRGSCARVLDRSHPLLSLVAALRASRSVARSHTIRAFAKGYH